MITKEKFIQIIEDYKDWDREIDYIYDNLHISLYDCPIIIYTDRLFSDYIKSIFNKNAQENIDWWLYEKRNNPELTMLDKDGNEIPTETIEDLWEIVKNNQK